jgi:uncharacterized membrane protein
VFGVGFILVIIGILFYHVNTWWIWLLIVSGLVVMLIAVFLISINSGSRPAVRI